MARLGEQVSLAEANLQYLIEEADRRAPVDGGAGGSVRVGGRRPRRPVTSAGLRTGREP